MFHKTLVVDNDLRFADSLKKAMGAVTEGDIDIYNFKSDSLDDIYEYDLYIIRFDELTYELIRTLSKKNKFIIITTNFDTQEIRESILSFHVSDYVITNSHASIGFVCKLARRLECNSNKNILLVDDSKLILTQISMLLDSQNINHIQCHNGAEAWEYLQDPTSKKIDLVVSDYEMPQMNGYDFVKKIRSKFTFDELPVLILSGTGNTYMISRFLKAGANDYIPKPFINEEFIGRISNALTVVDMFNEIKNMAMTDQLTGLHNRMYFYDAGVKIYEGAKRAKNPISVAMIDIDNFKSINDTYGHEVGDQALKHVSKTIKKSLRRSDVFVRFGGEEFVILLPNTPHDQAMKVTKKVCSLVEKAHLTLDDGTTVVITISIGVTSEVVDIDKMLEKADRYMYTAKQNGKNQVYSEE